MIARTSPIVSLAVRAVTPIALVVAAYVLLHHYMGDVDGNVGSWGFARGGMGAVANSIAGAFQAYGGEIRSDARVDKIIVKNGKATGVALENGEEISARLVVSSMDVKRTFLQCMDQSDLPKEFYNRVKHFKIRGSSGKLNIALDGLPDPEQPGEDTEQQVLQRLIIY